jgi:hypothetical protein
MIGRSVTVVCADLAAEWIGGTMSEGTPNETLAYVP